MVVLFSYNFITKDSIIFDLLSISNGLLPLNDFPLCKLCARWKFSLKFTEWLLSFHLNKRHWNQSIDMPHYFNQKIKPDNDTDKERRRHRKYDKWIWERKWKPNHQWNASVENASSKPCHRISYSINCKCDPIHNR